MKKYLLSLLVIALGIFVASTAMAAVAVAPGSGIKNSAHDLSFASGNAAYINELVTDPATIGGTFIDRFWLGTDVPQDERSATGMDRICIYCHAPHHTISADQALAAGIGYYPLWNRELSVLTYTVYDNGDEDPQDLSHSLNADLGQPGGVSKLCLSCHDGSVALNSYGNYSYSESKGDGSEGKIGDTARKRALIGELGDLSNHHPIGFDFATVAAQDDEIAQPTAAMGTTGYTIDDLLWYGSMECTTCHDVHNTKNQGSKFTWVHDAQSAFCLTCHLK